MLIIRNLNLIRVHFWTYLVLSSREAGWPNGQHAGLQIERYGLITCSLARHLVITVPLSTKLYKWVTANSMLRGNPAMDKKYSQPLLATENGINSNCINHKPDTDLTLPFPSSEKSLFLLQRPSRQQTGRYHCRGIQPRLSRSSQTEMLVSITERNVSYFHF